MKRFASFALILAYLLTLCACTRTEKPKKESAEQTLPAVEAVAIQEPVYVYEGAEEYYLQPVNAFSWKRQYAPEIVMIHFMSDVENHPEDPYDLNNVRRAFVEYDVSVHYIVLRDGTIQCLIPENRVAWHAGSGQFQDPKYTNAMNQYAIGIEVLAIGSEADMSIYMSAAEYQGLDDALKGYTEAQYQALALLVADICQRNSIPLDREHVIGHQDYAPGKNDPGELFDWSRILPEITN